VQDATIFTRDIALKTIDDIKKTLVKKATLRDNVITELDDFTKINLVVNATTKKAFCTVAIANIALLNEEIKWRAVNIHNLVSAVNNEDDKQYAKSIATVFQPSINFLQPKKNISQAPSSQRRPATLPLAEPKPSTNQSRGIAPAHTADNRPNFFIWLWNSIVSGLYRFFSFKWLFS
jgi:hypothetical protein